MLRPKAYATAEGQEPVCTTAEGTSLRYGRKLMEVAEASGTESAEGI
jgi:hypothetical protein